MVMNEEYTWTKDKENGHVCLWINEKVKEELGEIVGVELEKIGSRIYEGDKVATIKGLNDSLIIYSTVSGYVQRTNGDLEANPEVLNEKTSWLVETY